jgi:hypothetical protein
LRKLLALAAAVLVARWAALEAAAFVAGRRPRRERAPLDEPVAPGTMPGPYG